MLRNCCVVNAVLKLKVISGLNGPELLCLNHAPGAFGPPFYSWIGILEVISRNGKFHRLNSPEEEGNFRANGAYYTLVEARRQR